MLRRRSATFFPARFHAEGCSISKRACRASRAKRSEEVGLRCELVLDDHPIAGERYLGEAIEKDGLTDPTKSYDQRALGGSSAFEPLEARFEVP
jgi:hypothetical protein